MVVGNEHATLNERGRYLSGSAFLVVCQHWNLRALHLSRECRLPQNHEATFLESLCAHFLFNVDFDATKEFAGLQQGLHEGYLIDRALEKEPAKRKKAGLGQVSAPVKVSAAGMICCSESGFVLRFFAREPTSNRPEGCPYPEPLEERVRHQSRDAAIAIQKRMDPQEAMVNRAYRQNLAQTAQLGRSVCLVKARQETRHAFIRRRHVLANSYINASQLTGNNFVTFA